MQAESAKKTKRPLEPQVTIDEQNERRQKRQCKAYSKSNV